MSKSQLDFAGTYNISGYGSDYSFTSRRQCIIRWLYSTSTSAQLWAAGNRNRSKPGGILHRVAVVDCSMEGHNGERGLRTFQFTDENSCVRELWLEVAGELTIRKKGRAADGKVNIQNHTY